MSDIERFLAKTEAIEGHRSFGARPLGRLYGVSDQQVRNIVKGVQRA